MAKNIFKLFFAFLIITTQFANAQDTGPNMGIIPAPVSLKKITGEFILSRETKFLADSKTKIQNQLSRDMGNGIHSDVNIKDMNIQAIYPTAEKLVVRTYSSGQIKVKVVM